ncbi:archaetidylserine decarboxylase [Pseudomonas asiatica]|uniref:archaetidylserine decarboxylase n=1 Tax=Pseudomonas asiatica TaxID=2219225 RepID=UPI001E3F1061|nr:archaetidylserine decarboxylase [Pseudomonas asiatica]MCE0850130.1 archaetidylserine decarboxylase [Pseudomonas asiatica]
MSVKDRIFVLAQHLLPQHGLSRLAGYAAECRARWLRERLITWFIKRYQVDMQAAELAHPDQYEHFNAFFTRALKPGTRPLDADAESVVSPVDGAISQIGTISDGQLFQAKGHTCNLVELLGGDIETASLFRDGEFATLYLSPGDYHRVHMPVSGTLLKMAHVPGHLFSVNPLTASRVPRLFARNERVVCLFDTEFGPMAVVLVGAMIVASIQTSWAGIVNPPGRKVTSCSYIAQDICLEKGEEFARFRLGSTAIVLFAAKNVTWDLRLQAGSSVRMGSLIASNCKAKVIGH